MNRFQKVFFKRISMRFKRPPFEAVDLYYHSNFKRNWWKTSFWGGFQKVHLKKSWKSLEGHLKTTTLSPIWNNVAFKCLQNFLQSSFKTPSRLLQKNLLKASKEFTKCFELVWNIFEIMLWTLCLHIASQNKIK